MYVDTDLYLNKKEKDFVILDTYSISGLLEENKILYKGLNLGFDPYLDKNIDQKGKSYLKIRYNQMEDIDLISMREKNKSYFKKKDIQDNLINPVIDKSKTNNIRSIITYSFFIFSIVALMLLFWNKSNKDENYKISINQCKFLKIFISSLFILLFTIPITVKSCNIVGDLNEIDRELNIYSLKIVNKIYIILSFTLYGIILIFIVILCISRKKRENLSKKETEKKNVSNIC